MAAFRHPAVVVSHGPGPLWLLSSGFDGMNKDAPAAKLLSTLFEKLYPKYENLLKRILFVSAHFEANSTGFEISNAANPEMIYDYYGFDDEAYDVNYPAKGDTDFAQKVKNQLDKNKIKAKVVNRGFDHAAFVPISLIQPQADIPIVTMSINSYLGNEAHFNLGKVLAPLRDEDTLILCSGQSTHNLQNLHSRSPVLIEGARAFQNWLDETLSTQSKLSLNDRTQELFHWQDEPASRYAHLTRPSDNNIAILF